jgi:hypothetical protein
MDALSTLPESLAFVPTNQAFLLTQYEPDEWAGGTSAKAAPAGFQQFQQLRDYLVEHLISGPVEGLRDRISTLLRDGRYHELNSALGAVVPAHALVNAVIEQKSGEFRVRDLGEHEAAYAQ